MLLGKVNVDVALAPVLFTGVIGNGRLKTRNIHGWLCRSALNGIDNGICRCVAIDGPAVVTGSGGCDFFSVGTCIGTGRSLGVKLF